MSATHCPVCKRSSGFQTFEIPDFHEGSDKIFAYLLCEDCECLFIQDHPLDMSKYYTSKYYTFDVGTWPDSGRSFSMRIYDALEKRRNKYLLFGHPWSGRLLNMVKRKEQYFLLNLLRLVVKSPACSLLDVGCGGGGLVAYLQSLGLQTMGIDPFLDEDTKIVGGAVMMKRDLPQFAQETDKKFDVITFNHSFEHLSNPEENLSAAESLLAENGEILIRTPTVDSFAWRHYKDKWVQIDAPRHFIIHSKKSISEIAGWCGLIMYNVIYDSNDFQFWGSEQNKRGIPLTASCSYAVNRQNSIFTEKEICEFRQRAHRLNLDGQGDQAAFFLKRISRRE